MLIIINDDHAYLAWIAHHRLGFVLDTRRKPAKRDVVLHRATCPEIKAARSKKTHWTTGPHVKGCSLDLAELAAWAREQAGWEPACCTGCRPQEVAHVLDAETSGQADPSGQVGALPLTRLAEKLLDQIVEAAVIGLEQAELQYALTVGEVAAAVAKTPAQIRSAIVQLLEGNYITLAGTLPLGAPPPGDAVVFPTVRALQSLPAFAEMPPADVRAELSRLEGKNACT